MRRHETVRAPAGTRSALIVAGDEYRDPGLRRLRAPARDAEALARVLGDPAIGGFRVRTLLNEPTHVVSEMVEEFFTDRAPDDVLLLHFSCHGVKDDNGELYFATPTTKLNRLGATAVSAEFVSRRMSRSRSRRMILLLDCCYAGAWARGALPRAGMGVHVEEQFGGHGRVVITASNAMEYAFDGAELADAQEQAPSVFTRALVEGLESGDADHDQDGYVGIDELYDYVYDKVRQTTPGQTPGKWAFDLQGDLYVARRARPVTVPSPCRRSSRRSSRTPFPGSVPGRSRSCGACCGAGTRVSPWRPGWRCRSSSTTTAAPCPRRPPRPSPPAGQRRRHRRRRSRPPRRHRRSRGRRGLRLTRPLSVPPQTNPLRPHPPAPRTTAPTRFRRRPPPLAQACRADRPRHPVRKRPRPRCPRRGRARHPSPPWRRPSHGFRPVAWRRSGTASSRRSGHATEP
ncbi:caspase, EACC1-associated type [Microbispora sp. KK1-11]|uniref:caspase family protein n=1 Tax=Microbispora sp. KK1-11 TaxID=2053005 RepID=UPI00115BC33B|nr:caspase family protein [Microbispora sp. KK1-11]TQS27972.1 hypothetical protein FLW16_16180 [Microbispora sp. KK1-11]